MNIEVFPLLHTKGVYSNNTIPIFIKFNAIGPLEEYKFFISYATTPVKYIPAYNVRSFNFRYFFTTSKLVESAI